MSPPLPGLQHSSKVEVAPSPVDSKLYMRRGSIDRSAKVADLPSIVGSDQGTGAGIAESRTSSYASPKYVDLVCKRLKGSVTLIVVIDGVPTEYFLQRIHHSTYQQRLYFRSRFEGPMRLMMRFVCTFEMYS